MFIVNLENFFKVFVEFSINIGHPINHVQVDDFNTRSRLYHSLDSFGIFKNNNKNNQGIYQGLNIELENEHTIKACCHSVDSCRIF